jgi:hypothetical protein
MKQPWTGPARTLAALCGALLLGVAGCDDETFAHTPPAGQGAIVVDNDAYDAVRVYINGAEVGRVDADRWAAFDRAPGVYRVVLEETGSDRTYRDDIDVLAGRLTVLDVSVTVGDTDALYVVVTFD